MKVFLTLLVQKKIYVYLHYSNFLAAISHSIFFTYHILWLIFFNGIYIFRYYIVQSVTVGSYVLYIYMKIEHPTYILPNTYPFVCWFFLLLLLDSNITYVVHLGERRRQCSLMRLKCFLSKRIDRIDKSVSKISVKFQQNILTYHNKTSFHFLWHTNNILMFVDRVLLRKWVCYKIIIVWMCLNVKFKTMLIRRE